MRYVVVPKDVTVVDKRTGKPITITVDGEKKPFVFEHKNFVTNNMCADPRMSKGGGAGLRRQLKVEEAFANCSYDDIVGVEDADYLVCREIVDTLTWSDEFARFAPQVLSHVEAWEEASKHDGKWYREEMARRSGIAEPSEELKAV